MPLLFEKMPVLDRYNFCRRSNYQAFLYGKGMDIGGGTITREEIDELDDHPELTRISIAGLHQDTFDYFVTTYGDRFEAIFFFKNKMVGDLSALSTLNNVKSLAYFLNQRAVSLWDMSGNKSLSMLCIDDFSRLHSLNGIETAPSLKVLDFGNMVWATSEYDIIPDLEDSPLEDISFNAELSYENIYKFLGIKGLKELDFRSNLCKAEFLAWICSNYPHLNGRCLAPYYLYNETQGFINGKRKPHIDITNEKHRIKMEKAVADFDKMKQRFLGLSFSEIMTLINK